MFPLLSKRILSVGTALSFLLLGTVVFAQETYDVVPLPEKYRTIALTGLESDEQLRDIEKNNRVIENVRKNDRKAVVEALAGSGNMSVVEPFFREFLFPYLTQTDDDVVASFGSIRKDFLKDFLSQRVTGANRKQVVDLATGGLKKIAEGNYNPAARLNAVVMISMMDLSDGDSATLPQPNPDATTYLVSLLENNGVPLYLKVGAISGLVRITEILGASNGGNSADLKALSTFAVSVLSNQATGQDQWETDGSQWMMRRCVQVLGNLQNAGSNGDIAQTINNVITDSKLPIWIRADAVDALGKLTNIPAAALPTSIDNVIAFTGDALDREAIAIYKKVEEYVGRSLLFDDVYLIDPLGKNTQSKATQQNQGNSGGKAGGGKMPGGGMPGGGMPGGAAGQDEIKVTKSEFDLPNYSLNMFRRQAKGYLYYSHRTLGRLLSKPGFNDAGAQQRAKEAAGIIKLAADDTNAGLVDLKTGKAILANEITKGVSDLLHDRFSEYAQQLKSLVPRAAAADESAPNQ